MRVAKLITMTWLQRSFVLHYKPIRIYFLKCSRCYWKMQKSENFLLPPEVIEFWLDYSISTLLFFLVCSSSPIFTNSPKGTNARTDGKDDNDYAKENSPFSLLSLSLVCLCLQFHYGWGESRENEKGWQSEKRRGRERGSALIRTRIKGFFVSVRVWIKVSLPHSLPITLGRLSLS